MPTIQLVGWLVNTIKEAITIKINSMTDKSIQERLKVSRGELDDLRGFL